MWLNLLHDVVHLAEEDTLIMISEEFSSLALSLNVSRELVTEDTQWLTSELELAGGRFLKVLNHTSGLFHAAYLTRTKATETPSALLPAEVSHGSIA